MAENFSGLSVEDLRKQIPKGTLASRWRGLWGKNVEPVIPDAEQLTEVDTLRNGIENREVIKRLKESADKETKSLKEHEILINELSESVGDIKNIVDALAISSKTATDLLSFVVSLRADSNIEKLGFEPSSLFAITRGNQIAEMEKLGSKASDFDNASRIIIAERGVLRKNPVAEDMKMLDNVVVSEKKVVVLAREVIEALAELKSENVSVVDIDRLMGLMTVFKAERSSAVSVVAGSEEVMKGLGELEVRRVARDSEAAKNWKSITNYEHDVLRLEDPKIAPKEIEMIAGDLKGELDGRMDVLKIKEGKVRIKILERVGIKGEEIDKNGLLAKRENHRAKYEAAMLKMEALLVESKTRPTAAVEAYLALNSAIVEGSAVVQLDNAIKIVMMKTKTDFMSLVLKSIPMPSESTGALLLKFDMFGRKSEGKMYEIIGKAARQVEEFARNVAKWAESEADRAKGKNLTNTNN
jgi:hypothetical protein